MFIGKYSKILILIILIFWTFTWVYFKYFERKKEIEVDFGDSIESYKSNIIENVEYVSKDTEGNKYTIKAAQGEIDISNPSILFLTKVSALIQLVNSEDIRIMSDYGKYNSDNFDTIFSKNVIINYSNHKITGNYLDFSLEKNLMFISKDVIYTDSENVIKSDVIEVNIKTKDVKIFMHNKEDKVNIKNN